MSTVQQKWVPIPDDLPLPGEVPVIIIRPSRGWISLNLRDLWEYRELFYFLTWRDVKVRYKQTVLGAAWAIIQPFFTMVVFSLFFGKLARMPSDDIPYPIFSYAALVPWTFFANGLSQSSGSLVASANLIKKVYFPRLVVPISAVISGGVDFALAFVVLLGMMLFYGIVPTAAILWLPLLLLLALVTSLGVGLWLTAMMCEICRRISLAVPRRALRSALPDPGLDVRHTHRLPQQPARRAVAHPVRHQPHGRRDRGLSLGAAGGGDCARPSCLCISIGGRWIVGQWGLLLPTDGKDICRCGVTNERHCHSSRRTG
jgi:hypothetical protein